MKIKISIILMIISLCSMAVSTYAQENIEGELVEKQQNNVNVEKVIDELKRLGNDDTKELLDYDPARMISELIKGGLKLDTGGFLRKILNYLLKEVYQNINLVIKLLVLAILSALLMNLNTSFLNESTGQLAFYIFYIVMISVLAAGFGTAVELGNRIVDQMLAFMYSTLPVLITLLVSGGNIITGSVLSPAVIMMVEIFSTLIRNIFIPAIVFATALSFVNNLSEKIQIGGLAQLIRKICLWGLGFMLTIFVAVLSLQGSVGAVADGVAGKSIKFAIGAVPVVGGYLSDAADTVMSCALLIKNAAGVAVMAGVIVLCLVPLLKLGALILVYKIAAVIIQPVSDKRIVNSVNDVSKSLSDIFAMVFAVSFMFIISVTAILGAGNLSAMLR